MKTALVLIDFENCFGDTDNAPLRVPGALRDLRNTVHLIARLGDKITSIYASMCVHPWDHIPHACRWVDQEGNNPAPFTLISYNDVKNGVWQAAQPRDRAWQLEYTRLLGLSGRTMTVWPVHGQAQTWEQELCSELLDVLAWWEQETGRKVTYIRKGTNRDTEQFGIFGAEVPLHSDPSTYMNQGLIDEIADHDITGFAGEALSHCVMDSVNQFIEHKRSPTQMFLLSDCMSPVPQAPGGPDFPAIASAWLKKMYYRDDVVVTESRWVEF